jgi:radical SAM superfamily enzyme YgiQ (UPF0313 family)
MSDAGFSIIFVGIESPDEETLRVMQKKQNTKRSLEESLQKIHSYGILVNAGYIVGFDTEKGSVAQGVIDLIEASAVPVNMVGLLVALPNTQLQRRLAAEERLPEDYEVVSDGAGDQCTGGLNFITKRPRAEILSDYRRIIAEAYTPEAYFGRVLRSGLVLNCSNKKLKLPFRMVLRDLKTFGRLCWHLGVRKSYRRHYWRTLFAILRRNHRALRYSGAMMGLYLHFGDFQQFLLGRLDEAILAETAPAPHEGNGKPPKTPGYRSGRGADLAPPAPAPSREPEATVPS